MMLVNGATSVETRRQVLFWPDGLASGLAFLPHAILDGYSTKPAWRGIFAEAG